MKLNFMKVFITGFIMAASAASNADFIQVADRATFDSLVASQTTETFNSYTSNVAFGVSGVDVGDFTMTSTVDSSILRIEADGSEPFNIDGTAFVRGVGLTGDFFTFSFNSAITAFGLDMFGINNDAERSKILIGMEEFALPVVVGNQNSFFGVVSDTAFNTISFATLAAEDGSFDNVSYGIAKVSEPSIFALLGLSIVALVFTSRRK